METTNGVIYWNGPFIVLLFLDRRFYTTLRVPTALSKYVTFVKKKYHYIL